MEWTEQRIEMLRRLWGQGQTASQIAAALGGVTRNAVIGKAHRLGLTGRPSPIKRDATGGEAPKRRPAARRMAINPQPKPMLPMARTASTPQAEIAPPAAPAAQERPRAYQPQRSHAGGKACSWPMGDPKQPGFHFCGEPAEPGRPYCGTHCQQAYQRKSEAA